MKLGVVVAEAEAEAAAAAGPHPHAAMTALPSTNADKPAIVSELQEKKKEVQGESRRQVANFQGFESQYF